MGSDRYDTELRRQRLEKRKREVRRRVAVFGGCVVVVIVLAVSLGGRGHRRRLAAQELERGVKAVQACFVETFGDSEETVPVSAEKQAAGRKSFGAWVMDTYSGKREAILKRVRKGQISGQGIYEALGETMHVLRDRYDGKLDDAQTAKEQGIFLQDGKTDQAEVVIAGDLCFAEDGFVLDHYDTVNDLSQCISPEILQMSNDAVIFYLNHEYCISDRGEPLEGKLYTFRAKPERMGLLKEMGTDLVSLANNHVYDYGRDAMMDTMDLLDQAEIPYVGGGRNSEEARRPVYFVVNGMKIGFVAATNAEIVFYTPKAETDSPGVLEAYDPAEYKQVISDAAGQCDYLIAYIHWGPEDTNTYEENQHNMGAEFLQAGADIVVGGHPHVLQGIEYIDGRPVVYSMGDFWFNDETKYTGLLKLDLTPEGLKQMSFVPCLQTGFTTQYISDQQEQTAFYDFLEGLSPNAGIDENGVVTEKK